MKKRKSIEKEMKLKELGEISGGTRDYTRCKRCGRPHSIVRKYNLCIICYREALKRGEIPGRDF